MTFTITCSFKESSVCRCGLCSSWDCSWFHAAIRGLHLLSHGPRDPFLVCFDASPTALGLAHGLGNPFTAVCTVRLATLCLAVLQDMFALRAVAIVAVLLKVLAIDAHLARGSRRRSLGSGAPIGGYAFELDSFSLLPLLPIRRDSPYTGHRLGAPSLTLGPPRD